MKVRMARKRMARKSVAREWAARELKAAGVIKLDVSMHCAVSSLEFGLRGSDEGRRDVLVARTVDRSNPEQMLVVLIGQRQVLPRY